MTMQYFGQSKYLVSFLPYELKLEHISNLTKKLLTNKNVRRVSDYNYVIPKEFIPLIDDIKYYPFTKKEIVEGEREMDKFLLQFDEIII